MFDIGFSEMMVIALVALVVIGPERLPKFARTIGTLLGRMQRYVNDVKTEVEREIRVEELKKLQTTVEDSARSIERSVYTEANEAERSLRKMAEEALPKVDSGAPAAVEPVVPQESPGQFELELSDSPVSRKQP
jgi:sec-independent protein translocase protein TatB